ncbi:MAG: hypothetical protein H7Y88_05555 [Phycisphaerales bacterium]|nr:hypothetical protein [Phycisphaerales bacterium]
MRNAKLVGAIGVPLLVTALVSGQTVRSAGGVDGAAIQGTLDLFRADLGVLNPNQPGSFGSGRREINWDGVPDTFSAPNSFPANFFNVNSPRGTVFSTPGTSLMLNADSSNPTATPNDFGNINPVYQEQFAPFSGQRMFTAIDSNVTDVHFFVPGSTDAAVVRGFGVVFSDVDLADSTRVQFFDAGDNEIFNQLVLPGGTAEGFSFLGASFATSVVARVRITSGNGTLGAAISEDPAGLLDLVVMDDFVYGEPVLIPGPGVVALCGVAGVLTIRRRRR